MEQNGKPSGFLVLSVDKVTIMVMFLPRLLISLHSLEK